MRKLQSSSYSKQFTLPSREVDSKHDLGLGVTLEFLYQGRIVYIEAGKPTRECVDLYMDIAVALMNDWDQSAPLLLAVDMSDYEVMYTPYLRKRVQEFPAIAKSLGLRGRLALVSKRRILSQAVRLLMKLPVFRTQKGIRPQLFYSRETAMTWLVDAM